MAAKKKLPFLSKGGAMLADRDIELAVKNGYLKIKTPHLKLAIQPASLDIHIAKTIMVFARRRVRDAVIDLKRPIDQFVDYEYMDDIKGAVLHPREFILGVTDEFLEMPEQLAASTDGKSSLGRLGLVIHATAGFIDPGFKGHVTLEITNLTDQPLIIYPHMPIGQLRFTVLSSPAQVLYGPSIGSKYSNDYSENPRPIPSQFWKTFLK